MKRALFLILLLFTVTANSQTVDSAVPIRDSFYVVGSGEREVLYKPKNGPEQTLLTNVRVPTMQVHHPAKAYDRHFAVLVFPGGGFGSLSMTLEGESACKWINDIGGTAILVKYRVPSPAGTVRGQAALQDAQQAMRLTRDLIKNWGIDNNRLGVLGFSAGGKLAAWISVQSSIDRPAFTILVYPAYLSSSPSSHTVGRDLKVDSKTPPTFIVQTFDDSQFIAGTIAYFLTLRRYEVPSELHVFAGGGHGYGLGHQGESVAQWPTLASRWLDGFTDLRFKGNPQ